MQTPTGPQPAQSAESIIVQFCPCGHTATMTYSELLEQLGAEQYDQFMEQVNDPNKLDAPILGQRECPQCKEQQRQDVVYAQEVGLGLDDPDDRFNALH